MSTPYIGQIQVFAFNFPPKNYAFCAGALMAISQNQALFAILGTTYGGNGTTTFALPDLRGRLPFQNNGNYPIGMRAGSETVTLVPTNLPMHNHLLMTDATTTGDLNSNTPAGNEVIGQSAGTASGTGAFGVSMYNTGAGPSLNFNAIAAAGNSQPHSNLMPYLTINYCIALSGIFPSRN